MTNPKLCVNCVHEMKLKSGEYCCLRTSTRSVDLVTGEEVLRGTRRSCEQERDVVSSPAVYTRERCGQEGEFYEEKQVEKLTCYCGNVFTKGIVTGVSIDAHWDFCSNECAEVVENRLGIIKEEQDANENT